MEAFAIVILCILAFYGLFLTMADFLKIRGSILSGNGYKLILRVPRHAEDSLEGTIRAIFQNEINAGIIGKEKLYLLLSEESPDVEKIIASLQELYPLEVLPDGDRYCMITDSKKEEF